MSSLPIPSPDAPRNFRVLKQDEAVTHLANGNSPASVSRTEDTGPLARLMRVAARQRSGNLVDSAQHDLVDASEELVAAAMERVKQHNDEVDLAATEGRNEGFQAGIAEARHELAAELHRVGREVASFRAALEEAVVDIALATAKRAVGVQLDPASTRRLAREAIAPHLGDTLYEIRVAPAVAERYRAAVRDLAAEHPGTPMPVVRLDPRLPEGRAILFTKFASIDLDLDSQIEAMRLHLEA